MSLSPFAMRHGGLNGVEIISSPHAYEIVPIFPDKKRSKRRNRRVMGKYGRLDRMNPLTYRANGRIICHPSIYAEIRRRFT